MAISVENHGHIAAVGDWVMMNAEGFSGLGIQVTGSWTGTLQFEGSVDGSAFVSLGAAPPCTLLPAVTSTTANGAWQASCHGLKLVRVRASALAAGVALVTLRIDPSGGGSASSGGGGGGGAVTIADGADAAEGATTDAAVLGDNAGTVSAKLRGLSQIWNDVWDSVNHWLKVSIQNATLAVTQSGAWSFTGADTTVTGTLAENANGTAIALAGQRGVSVTFAADTFSASTDINTQVSYDGGTKWATGGVFVTPQTTTATSAIALFSGSGVQYTIAFNGAPTHVRLQSGASGASGSVAYTLKATLASPIAMVFGRDGSIMRPVQVTTAGLLRIDWANAGRAIAATATLSSVANSASNVTLLAANSSRKGMILFNDSTKALYLKFGATATSESFTFKVFPSQTYTMDAPLYQGIIDGIWASIGAPSDAARITELS